MDDIRAKGEKAAFCETNAVNIMERDTGFAKGIVDDGEGPISMVLCGVSRLEPLARRSYVGVPDVGEDGGRSVYVVFDDACAKLVG